MKQQKKLAVIEILVIGLLVVSLILVYSFLFDSVDPSNTSVIATPDNIFPNRHTIPSDSAWWLAIILAVSSVLSIWFIRRLTKEIKKRREEECELYLSEIAVKASSNGVMITDNKGKMVFVNPAFEEITGYQLDEVLGQNPNMLSSGRHNQAFFQQMWTSLEKKGRWEGEVWNRRKNGELYLEWLNIIKIPKTLFNNGAYLAIFSDITLVKNEENSQAFQATHDPLTKLSNRNLFYEQVKNEFVNCAHNRSHLVMLFIDLDAFKAINDTYGHLVGDEVLIKVSQRITRTIRQSDTVCRYGGDEFIVLLPNVSTHQDWTRIVENLLEHLSKPYLIDAKQLQLSASIGVAIHGYDDKPMAVSDFIHLADEAMYQAKMSGKNGYVMTNKQTEKLPKSLSLSKSHSE